MCGHDRPVIAGEQVELPAAAAMDRLDGVAALVANLPVVTEKHAFAAGRAERSRAGEMGLPRMRCSGWCASASGWPGVRCEVRVIICMVLLMLTSCLQRVCW